MKTRPVSVTVIAWILIAIGGLSIITSTAMINNPQTRELMSKNPLPIPVQYVQLLVPAIGFLCGGRG